DALGWSDDVTVEHRRGAGMAERHGDRPKRPATSPAPSITAGANRRLVLDRRPQRDGTPVRTVDCGPEPSPPLGSQVAGKWVLRRGDRPGTEAIRLTLRDALILQGFPPDYPVQGGRTKQFEQVGNAVPPPLAAAVVAAVARPAVRKGVA